MGPRRNRMTGGWRSKLTELGRKRGPLKIRWLVLDSSKGLRRGRMVDDEIPLLTDDELDAEGALLVDRLMELPEVRYRPW